MEALCKYPSILFGLETAIRHFFEGSWALWDTPVSYTHLHISSAHEGDTVRAVATIVHKGRSSHVWNVDVFTSTNKLVSSIRVVNSVMKKR